MVFKVYIVGDAGIYNFPRVSCAASSVDDADSKISCLLDQKLFYPSIFGFYNLLGFRLLLTLYNLYSHLYDAYLVANCIWPDHM